jgi:hypothetical protein
VDVALDQIEKLIERRSRKEPDPDELSPSYQESGRRYHARRREALRWEWIRFYERLAENHARLAEENRCKAAALLPGGEGVGT